MKNGVRQYAFFFDSSACSGCKSCQVACKDKHDLPVGLLWRRVYEVASGSWSREGDAWQHSVVAYHLSIACNHCGEPTCMSVCPTQAIGKREDGIVLIDHERCMGCQYCGWACPYGALQFDATNGRMTKCTFCAEELTEGRSPACVATCPMRALDFGDKDELQTRHPHHAIIYPLPSEDLTRPALITTAHRSADKLSKPTAVFTGTSKENSR